MSHIVHDIIARGDARIVELPTTARVRHQVEADRNFGLPTALYGVTVGCYLGFLVIVGSAFVNPALAIPMAVIVLLIAAFSRFRRFGRGLPATRPSRRRWASSKHAASSPIPDESPRAMRRSRC